MSERSTQTQKNNTTPPTAIGTGQLTIEAVSALAKIMKDYDLSELTFESADERIHLVGHRPIEPIGRPVQPAGSETMPTPSATLPEKKAAPPAAKAADDASVVTITAPLLGTFYRSASPESPPFVDVGQRVRKGQTLCIIEAMKLMNELECETDGVVVEVLSENGRPVEFGAPLFRINTRA